MFGARVALNCIAKIGVFELESDNIVTTLYDTISHENGLANHPLA